MKKVFKVLKTYGVITLGCLVAACSINLFLAPHAIVSGGASGVAILVNRITGLPVGMVMLLANIPLYLLGLLLKGKSFGLRTLYGTLLFAVLTEATAFLPGLTQNLLMAAIFGGVGFGVGFGTVFLAGGSTGGTDILAVLGNKVISAIDVGKWIFLIDAFIISAGAYFSRNAELVLAGILTLFLTSFLTDYILNGANVAKVVYIVSDNAEKISCRIMEEMKRGVTGIYTKGMYKNKNRTMLMCVVKRFEIQRLEQIVGTHDENAFIIYSQARRVSGEGFLKYPIQ